MKFICATREYTTFESFVSAPYFRKSFVLDEDGALDIKIAVCGFYELYLNGRRVTKGRLAPYMSNTDDIVYADVYHFDLSRGENVLGVHLGNGLHNNPSGYIWDFDNASFRSPVSFALEGEFTGESGEKTKLDTDGFKWHFSPVIYDDFRFGEMYDARLEINGWSEAGFDDLDWHKPLEARNPRGEVRVCEAEPILPQKELSPIKIVRTEKGWRYDFAENWAGVCRLKIKGERGQTVKLRHSDKLKDNGSLELFTGLWFPNNIERDIEMVHCDTYVCRGEGEEIYVPTFTYHGFCHVEVEGITDEQATEELLTFIVMNSDLKESGSFTTSHEALSKLQSMARCSTLSNFYYFPTDCPHREKQGWTGDAAISSEQVMINLHAEKSYREWLRNICRSQNYVGAIPGIVPTGGWGFRWGNGPAWDAALFEIPYNVYKYRGDLQIVRESAPAMMKYMSYLLSRRNDKGLVAWGLGDWVQPFHPFPTCPLVVSDTVMCYTNTYKAHLLLSAAGLAEQAEFAKRVSDGFRNAFRTHLIDPETLRVEGDCQCAQSMALYYGLFNDDEWDKAFGVLVDIIHREEDKPVIGMLGLRTLFHVLAKGGETDLALILMLREDCCSYGSLLAAGAVSLWERLNEPNQVSCSHNHHCHSHLSAFFIKDIAGIDYNPDADNLKRVDIHPSFPEKLCDAAGHFDANDGRISSAWKRQGEDIILAITVPDGFEGGITLPRGYSFDNGKTATPVKTGIYKIVRK